MRDERDTHGMPPSYAADIARNLRVARAGADLSQADVGERMRALGFASWLRQTMSTVEKGKRRVTAEEIGALALCLNTTIARLTHAESPLVEMPGGQAVPGRRFTYNDLSVEWDGNKPVIVPATPSQEARRQFLHEQIRAVERGRELGVSPESEDIDWDDSEIK